MELDNKLKGLLRKLKHPNLYGEKFTVEEIASDITKLSEIIDKPATDVLKIVLSELKSPFFKT